MSFQMKRPRSPSPQSESTSAKRIEISHVEEELKKMQEEYTATFNRHWDLWITYPLDLTLIRELKEKMDIIEARYWALYEDYQRFNPNHEDLPELLSIDLEQMEISNVGSENE